MRGNNLCWLFHFDASSRAAMRLQHSDLENKANGQTHKTGICVSVSCTDSMCMRSSCSLSPHTLLSSLLPACSHEPCQDFTHLRLLLSTMLAGQGGSSSSTITKASLSSGQKQSNDHRVDPTWSLQSGAARPGTSEAGNKMCARGASCLPPAAPPAGMLAECCRAGPQPGSLHPSDHIDQGSSIY